MDACTSDFASGVWQNWNGLDWSGVYRTVRRLQTRIAKAVRNGDWRDAKRLQKLLIRSTSGKALAVRQVTENRGRKTPGVDRETWSTPEHKWKAVQSLKTRGYRPLPLKRVNIPKTGRLYGPKRPLGIPTMKDRAMQALHLLTLEPISETMADENSYGFRPFRSTADALVHAVANKDQDFPHHRRLRLPGLELALGPWRPALGSVQEKSARVLRQAAADHSESSYGPTSRTDRVPESPHTGLGAISSVRGGQRGFP